MNLRQLEYFVSVAETLSFTKTAEAFFISQTAVTQQIKSLEEQLEVELLKRTKRHVELTPAGNVFLTEAKAILSRTESAIIKTKKAATGFAGNLNIGVVEGYGDPGLPDLLRSFRTGYPNISLSIRDGEVDTLYSLLLNQTLDVVINANVTYSRLKERNISYKVLNTCRLIVLLPSTHPLAFRNVLNLSELKNDSFIFTSAREKEDSFGHFKSTMAHFIRTGFTPHIVQNSESFNTTALMVAANMGIAVLPSYAIASRGNPGNLVTIPLDEAADVLEIVAARYEENRNPTIDKFMAYVKG